MTILTATKDNFASQLALAKGGDTLVLTGAGWPFQRVMRKVFTPPLTIDARAMSGVGFDFDRCQGIILRGGSFGPNSARAAGVRFGQCRDVEIRWTRLADLSHGIVFDRCVGFVADECRIDRMRVDGINVALSQKGRITRNVLQAFTPESPATHPDGIQAWSRPGGTTADLTIEDNIITGDCQGIGLFNHVRDGVDDGGFDRIVIRRNRVAVSFPQGIAVLGGRDCVIEDNDVQTLAGARHRASVNIIPPTGNSVARNTMSAKP